MATRPRDTPETRTGAARAAGGAAIAGGLVGVAGGAGTAQSVQAAMSAVGQAGTITAASAASIVKALGDGLDAFAGGRFSAGEAFVSSTLADRYPDEKPSSIKDAVSREGEFEEAFRAKMRDRVQTELPRILAVPDPAARKAEVLRMLEREKRFSAMRQEAMLNRGIARMEFNLLKRQSPEGGYWKLSPFVKEHTLDCIAMGERFWPWSVLEKIAPPLHAGCPCELWGLDEAIEAGFMTRDQVPDEADAEKRYRELMGKVKELEDDLGIEECVDATEEILRSRGLAIEEAVRHTGAMVALYPPASLARKLAVDGGEPRGELHVTLVFLGEAAKIKDVERLRKIVAGVAATSPTLSGEIAGRGLFTAGPKPVTYASIDVPGLEILREKVATALRDGGFFVADDHGFTPHMTLAYDDTPVDVPNSKLAFGEVALVIGGRKVTYPLAGLQEAREPLRWAKGLDKGGQFKPNRGGVARHIMKSLGSPTTPVDGRRRGDGKWAWVDGRYTRVPEHKAWERRGARGKVYTSPPGSTNVYRDGQLVADDAPERSVSLPPTADPNPDLVEKVEAAREAARDPYVRKAIDAIRARAGSKPPVAKGDGPEALMALPLAGFSLQTANTTADGDRLTFSHGDSRLSIDWDGQTMRKVDWDPSPPPQLGRTELERPPFSWGEFAQDALGWADTLGDRFDAEVALPEVRVVDSLSDHAGQRQWTGEVEIGAQAERDIDRAGKVRQRGQDLTDDEARGVYASYWAAAHEISHAVNPISPYTFNGANANLEEGLADEVGHLLALERLADTGQYDVIQWRRDHLDDPAVRGNYLTARAELAQMLDDAGIVDEEDRRQFVFDLKFRTAPEDRMDAIADAINGHADKPDVRTEDIEARLRTPGNAKLRPALTLSPGWLDALAKSVLGDRDGGTPEPKGKPKPPEYIGGVKNAPEGGVIPAYDRTKLELGHRAGGSNGAQWAFDADGRRWLVKRYRGDRDRVATELLANAVYREMGIRVPEAGTMAVKGDTALTYPTVDGEPDEGVFRREGPQESMAQGYMTDALLANWDFVGMTDDNVLWDDDDRPVRLDQGGTFEFRAQGDPKPYGPIPTEVWTMLSKGQGARAVKIDEDQMRTQAADIADTLTPAKVDELVDAAPFDDEPMRERVRENLKARVAWMGGFAGGEYDLPRPLEGDDADRGLRADLRGFNLFPEQEAAIGGYLGGADVDVDRQLRDRSHPKAPAPVERMMHEMDSAFRGVPTTSEDFVAYVGLDLDDEDRSEADAMVGKTVRDRGYVKATLDADEATHFSTVMRLVIPEGSNVLYTPALGVDGDRVLLPRDTDLRITGWADGDGKVAGVPTLIGTVATHRPYKPFIAPKKKSSKKPKSVTAKQWLAEHPLPEE